MDFGHFIRLEKSRRELREQQRELGAGGEAELAEGLRPALTTAIETLHLLHDDATVWDSAQNVITALERADLAQVREDYSRVLPPLLKLFGYAIPPPPPAEQLVNETVSLLNDIGDGEVRPEEVHQAREQLGELLARADQLPLEPPWRVVQTATEVNRFLELGQQVVVGGGVGALAGVFTGVAAGAITGGIGPIAGFIVFGGVRRFQRLRAFERETEEFLRVHEILTSGVFPATAAAAVQHLDQVLALSAEPGGALDIGGPLRLSANLDALIDISRRFMGDPRRTTVINQAHLRNDNLPGQLLPLLCRVYEAAERARAELALHGAISQLSREQLRELRDELRRVLQAAGGGQQ